MSLSMTRTRQRVSILKDKINAGTVMDKVYDEFAALCDDHEVYHTLGYTGVDDFAAGELGIKRRTAYRWLRVGRIRRVMKARGLRYPPQSTLTMVEWEIITPTMVDSAKRAMFKDEAMRFEDAVRSELHGEELTLDYASLNATNPAVQTTLTGIAALINEPAEAVKADEEALVLALMALT